MAEAKILSRKQTGCQSYKVGEIIVTTVADGHRSRPLTDDFILNASREQINASLAEAGLPADNVPNHFNPVVIETGSKRVLIDTGNGQAAAAQPGSTTGKLTENLLSGGLPPESIDIVVISHCHGDHVRGLLNADGKPAFPNAELKVPSGEWAFWMDDAQMAKAKAGRMEELFVSNRQILEPFEGKVTLYDDGEDVAPGVTAMLTPGHSIGHMSFMVRSGADRLFIQSDLTNNPVLFARNPTWQARFDQFPEQAVETRRKIYDMLVKERIPVQGFHYPFPSRALIEADGDRYKLIPID